MRKPRKPDPPASPQDPDPYEVILARLDELEAKLEALTADLRGRIGVEV